MDETYDELVERIRILGLTDANLTEAIKLHWAIGTVKKLVKNNYEMSGVNSEEPCANALLTVGNIDIIIKFMDKNYNAVLNAVISERRKLNRPDNDGDMNAIFRRRYSQSVIDNCNAIIKIYEDHLNRHGMVALSSANLGQKRRMKLGGSRNVADIDIGVMNRILGFLNGFGSRKRRHRKRHTSRKRRTSRKRHTSRK